MDARFHLRDSTRAEHERTDAAFSALDLAQRDDYRVFLTSHLLAYRSLEPVFGAALSDALRPPSMAGFLADDLRALDVAEPEMDGPVFDGNALGAAYVVAGSHFGKRVLSRRQGRSDDDVVRSAGHYLGSSALKTYWPVLLQEIEQASPDELERLADGASAAFTLFADCLTLARKERASHEFA